MIYSLRLAFTIICLKKEIETYLRACWLLEKLLLVLKSIMICSLHNTDEFLRFASNTIQIIKGTL